MNNKNEKDGFKIKQLKQKKRSFLKKEQAADDPGRLEKFFERI